MLCVLKKLPSSTEVRDNLVENEYQRFSLEININEIGELTVLGWLESLIYEISISNGGAQQLAPAGTLF
jgi:hypothetical protein